MYCNRQVWTPRCCRSWKISSKSLFLGRYAAWRLVVVSRADATRTSSKQVTRFDEGPSSESYESRGQFLYTKYS